MDILKNGIVKENIKRVLFKSQILVLKYSF